MTPPTDPRPDLGAAKPRICVLCKFFHFDGGSPGYSELTPGSSASMECFKGVWRESSLEYKSTEDYRRMMLTADACRHFELADDLKVAP